MNLKRIITTFLCLCFSASAAAAEINPFFSNCLSQILSNRYSGYEYDATRMVTHAQIKEILEAGSLAPSSYNEQPWNMIVCDKNKSPEAFNKAFNTLVEFNKNWAKHVPVLIICIASNYSANKEANPWAQYDTGAAAFSMMLKATSLGLMAHQMGGFDAQKIRSEFSIPEGHEPISVMAIGYQTSGAAPKKRERKPLGENFFSENWGKKFE